jgi:hypothetical protein
MMRPPDTPARVAQLVEAFKLYVDARRTQGRLAREPAPDEAPRFACLLVRAFAPGDDDVPPLAKEFIDAAARLAEIAARIAPGGDDERALIRSGHLGLRGLCLEDLRAAFGRTSAKRQRGRPVPLRERHVAVAIFHVAEKLTGAVPGTGWRNNDDEHIGAFIELMDSATRTLNARGASAIELANFAREWAGKHSLSAGTDGTAAAAALASGSARDRDRRRRAQ